MGLSLGVPSVHPIQLETAKEADLKTDYCVNTLRHFSKLFMTRNIKDSQRCNFFFELFLPKLPEEDDALLREST